MFLCCLLTLKQCLIYYFDFYAQAFVVMTSFRPLLIVVFFHKGLYKFTYNTRNNIFTKSHQVISTDVIVKVMM